MQQRAVFERPESRAAGCDEQDDGNRRRQAPSVAIVAPRNTRFSPKSATSIDLYIHEIARMSRYARSITVFAQRMEHPFDDVDVRFWDRSEEFEAWTGRLAATKPDCLIVHQHMPTAARLARRFAPLPVALVRHNFLKAPRHVFSAWRKRHQMRRLSGLAFVSECVREVFEREWPGTGVPLFVTPNGIDPALWQPGDKERVIAFVGRLAPEKGVLEAAEALGQVLPRHPDWRGLFILDAKTAEPRYAERAMAAIAAAGPQVQLMTNQPHDAVRAAMARATIALAPTQNAEPFGRVAVEALSSGAALVASRAGGFVEIAGEAGVLLDTPSAENIAHALERLIAEPARMAALGAAGRARVARRYDLASAAGAFDAMVDRLTGRPTRQMP